MVWCIVCFDYCIYDWDGDGQLILVVCCNEYLLVLLVELVSGGVSVIGFNVFLELKCSEVIWLVCVVGQLCVLWQVNMICGGSVIVVYWLVSWNEFVEDGFVQDSDGLCGFVLMVLEIGKLVQQILSLFEMWNVENWFIDVID